MVKKRARRNSNPDFRRSHQCPTPPIKEREERLWQLLSPSTFKPMKQLKDVDGKTMRSRLLTLPVMVAVTMSLIYRQVQSLSELLRVLALEGLLDISPMKVSTEALSKRLRRLPVSLFVELWE